MVVVTVGIEVAVVIVIIVVLIEVVVLVASGVVKIYQKCKRVCYALQAL